MPAPSLRAIFLEPAVMLATVLQWLIISTITGALVGTGVSLFLHALFILTAQEAVRPYWQTMLLLPLGGLVNGLLLYYGYKYLNHTGLKDNIIDSVYEQKGRMPLWSFPLKPIAALVTLATAGSAGKEGPCSHIGASIASALGQLLKLNTELERRLVACGVSAGFAGVFGTPIAGAIYGVEVLAIGRIRHDFLLPAIIGGVTSFQVCQYWGIPYDRYPLPAMGEFSELLFLKTIVIGIICGLVARFYVDSFHYCKSWFERIRERKKLWPPLLPTIGGLILALLVLLLPLDYYGLSLPVMDKALHGQPVSWTGFLWKSILVAITLGSGFYGGVVTPQFVIGAVTGNSLAYLLAIDPRIGAAVGLVAVVASASNTPIAAFLMGVELFGSRSLIYVAGASLAAYLLIGHRSIYPDQRLAYPKSTWIRIRPELPVGQEKVGLSYGLLRWWSRHWPHRHPHPHPSQPAKKGS